jgi:PAS domain S-box-containing protein
MEAHLEMLKLIGWQALDLTPSDSADDCLTARHQTVDHEDADVWATLFDHAPCAIAIADRDGRLVRVNRKFCTLVGILPTEVTNHRLDEITNNFFHGASETCAATSIGEPFSCAAGERICTLSKQDGSAVWCRQTTIPCGSQSKQPHWAICYFDELRDSAEALQLLVESHQKFVQNQAVRLESLNKQLQEIGRLASELDREQAISLRRQVNMLLRRLAPLRSGSTKDDRSAQMIESAYKSAVELQQLVAGAPT